MEPQFITEAFAGHFPSIFNSSFPPNTVNSSNFTCYDFLNTPHISDSGFKHLTESVTPDKIPIFVIKGCSEIFIPFMSHF
jgi:hypothetical protein